MKCLVCKDKPATGTCGRCESVMYCSRACLIKDWTFHDLREHAKRESMYADEIIPGLWIGSIEALRDPPERAIVSCVNLNRQSIRKQGKDHLIIDLEDNEEAPIELYWEQVAKFIDKHNHRVLVHCMVGASRSVSMVVYYLVTRGFCKNAQEALHLIREKRPEADPNDGFWAKLKQL